MVRVQHLWFGSVFILAKWSLAIAIALPVAPAAAPAAPSASPSSLAGLAFARGRAFRSRLLVELVFLGRALVTLLRSGRLDGGGVLRGGVPALTLFASASTTAAPAATPAPPRPIAIGRFGPLLAFGSGCSDLVIFGGFAFGYGFIVLEVFDWGCQLRLLGG
jgi:hypothetical protein